MKDFGLSRDVPVKRGATALLFVDVQNYSTDGGGEYAHLDSETIAVRYGCFFREIRAARCRSVKVSSFCTNRSAWIQHKACRPTTN